MNEQIISNYKLLYQSLIPHKETRWNLLDKLEKILSRYNDYLLKFKKDEYIFEFDFNKFILEIKQFLEFQFKPEIVAKFDNLSNANAPNIPESTELKPIIVKLLLDVARDFNKKHSQQTIQLNIARYEYLNKIHDCLKNYGLHGAIYNRDRKSFARFNLLIEYLPTNRKQTKKEFVILLSKDELTTKYLDLYNDSKTILINGVKIPPNEIRRIKITFTLLKDDEIPYFKQKLRIYSDSNFILSGYDETNSLLKNPEIESSIELNSKLWDLIHERIKDKSKPLFFTGQFAEAVRTAFIELNDIIKQEYKSISGVELDGVKLMKKVFTEEQPVFVLSDLTTESGKNIQKGYSELFIGSITGIRNPKAHKNIKIEAVDALEKIFIASHLLKIFEKSKRKSDT
ncbi:MAG: TIGR02391 family protein [Saprospiraceae bacterium]|nr:TIGR02391 family protein [Saprospiraceae bacterium]